MTIDEWIKANGSKKRAIEAAEMERRSKMTDDEKRIEDDKIASFKEGIIEPIAIPRRSPFLLVGSVPPSEPCRVITEGQYQALIEVWRKAGYVVEPSRYDVSSLRI